MRPSCCCPTFLNSTAPPPPTSVDRCRAARAARSLHRLRLPPASTVPGHRCRPAAAPTRRDWRAIWTQSVERVLDVLRLPALRDRILIAAQPRCEPGVVPTVPASSFLQVAAPWLRTPEAATLPGTLIAPDGVLAGLLATTRCSSARSAAPRAAPFRVSRISRPVRRRRPRRSWRARHAASSLPPTSPPALTRPGASRR